MVDYSTRQLASELVQQKQRLDRIERGLATSQLGNSSLEGGTGIDMYDAAGNYRGRIGAHPDGSYGISTVNNGSPPPQPSAPVVQGVLGGLRIIANGFVGDARRSADFSHYNVYLAVGSDIGAVADKITADHGATVITGLPYVPHRVWLTSVNGTGTQSIASAETVATPQKAVSDDLLDGVVTDLKLADEAVTEAKLAAGAVTTVALGDGVVDVTKLADGSITGEKIAANTIAAGNIASDAIRTNHIAAGQVQAGNLAAGAVEAGKIAAGAVEAGNLAALAVTAATIAANAITTTKIAAGAITGEKIQAGVIISDATLQSGFAGRRVVVSGPGNDVRFYPVADETRYAQIYSYVPADLPDDIALELRAIRSDVADVRTKLYLNPNRAFLGVTDADDESVNAGGAVELLSDAAFFGYKSASATAGLHAYDDTTLIADGKFVLGVASPGQAIIPAVLNYAETGAGQEVTISYPFTMTSLVAPLLIVQRDDHNSASTWWVWAASDTSFSLTWTDGADAHHIYFFGFRY